MNQKNPPTECKWQLTVHWVFIFHGMGFRYFFFNLHIKVGGFFFRKERMEKGLDNQWELQRFQSRSWNSRSRTSHLYSWCAFDRLIIWQTLTEHLPRAMHYDTVPSPNSRPLRLVGIFKEPLPVLSTHRQRPEVLGNLSCWNRFCAHSEGRVSAGNQRDFSCERIQFRKKQ